VTDYLPPGFTLNDAAWTDNGDGTATISGGPLVAGAPTDLTITMTASASGAGEVVNWAEISDDDGDDVDSTPDTDPADDNQPGGPGDPTDDVIDNTPDGNGAADEDDHDPAGVTVEAYDLALQKVYTSDTSGAPTDGVVETGDDVTFTITVTNQGTVDAATFDVTDYLPAGFDLNDPVTANGAADGDHVNWAEISSDDGNDVDSTPDTDPADDNQPGGPGDPTDDVTDNTDDDEDDHDPAGITVATYDLALIKVYTSDTFGNATDGVIADGADVTFTITVINQGTIDATTFDVTDYLPVGFDLNDPAWADNGDGTATISGGPLTAGASLDLTITLTANGAADGSYINWAEISDDDGNDVDSTPNNDPDDDNQPPGPDSLTDNDVDNTFGDEDDHDPAPVTVASYDLALTKVYTSDTSGAPTDGVVSSGDDVTFTITVTNQGTVDAATFDVTDYLPAGFDLNDPGWRSRELGGDFRRRRR